MGPDEEPQIQVKCMDQPLSQGAQIIMMTLSTEAIIARFVVVSENVVDKATAHAGSSIAEGLRVIMRQVRRQDVVFIKEQQRLAILRSYRFVDQSLQGSRVLLGRPCQRAVDLTHSCRKTDAGRNAKLRPTSCSPKLTMCTSET